MNNFFCQLKQYGLIKVSGPDTAKFLQGQLTCNIDELNNNQTRLGACCNNQGRIISLLRAFRVAPAIYLGLPSALIEPTLTHLKKFAVFSKIKFELCIAQYKMLGVRTENELPIFAGLAVNALLIQDTKFIIRVPDSHYRYEIFVPSDILATTEEPLAQHLKQANENAWQLAEIRQGLADIYPETLEKFTPHELNLQLINAISFNKGCYQGQEIIARTQYRAKLKQHMYRAKLNSNTLPITGEKLITLDDHAVGYIVRSCFNETGTIELLVVLKDAAANSGKVCLAEDKSAILEILDLPYNL